MSNKRVFLDTNVIIEAYRINCWNAICSTYSIETVEECVQEALRGNPSEPGYVNIPSAALRTRLSQVHQVVPQEIAALTLNCPQTQMLDDGEQQLFARLFADNELPSPIIVLSTADKAALVAAFKLGWLDHSVSLEELARDAGVNRATLESLKLNHQENWHGSVRTKILLGVIP